MSDKREFFRRTAPDFVQLHQQHPAFLERRRVILDVVAGLRPIPRQERPFCLDLGCGPGILSLEFAHRGYTVTGIDEAPEMIALAEAQARDDEQAGAACAFLCADVEHIDWARYARPSLVLISSVLEYLQDPGALVTTISERLVEGGHLVITIPNPRSVLRIVERAYRQVQVHSGASGYMQHWTQGPTANDYVRMLRAAGLTPVTRRYFALPRAGYPLLASLSSHRRLGTLQLLAFRK